MTDKEHQVDRETYIQIWGVAPEADPLGTERLRQGASVDGATQGMETIERSTTADPEDVTALLKRILDTLVSIEVRLGSIERQMEPNREV